MRKTQTNGWRVRTGGREVDGGRTWQNVRRVDKLAVVAGVWAETLDVAPTVCALAAGRAYGGGGLSYSGHGAIVHGFVVAPDERRRTGCRPTRRAAFCRRHPLQFWIVNAKLIDLFSPLSSLWDRWETYKQHSSPQGHHPRFKVKCRHGVVWYDMSTFRGAVVEESSISWVYVATAPGGVAEIGPS